jgi:hypothetical protein
MTTFTRNTESGDGRTFLDRHEDVLSYTPQENAKVGEI